MRLLASFRRRLWGSQRGATGIIVAMLLPVLVGFGGVTVDLGHFYQVQRALQASTDASALAGAHYINCCTSAPNTAVNEATTYSSTSGGNNVIAGQTVTMTTGYPQLLCMTTPQVSCSGSNSANAIVVKQQASVPTWFGWVFGVNSVTLTATSTASLSGAPPHPLDIAIILDTTQSMNNPDPNCGGATQLDCALTGIQDILLDLWPTEDNVSLFTFPGLTNSAQVPDDYSCSATPVPAIAAYSAAPVYQIIAQSTDYKTSNTATTLNTSSNLVKAVHAGGTGCSGLKAQGGVGTFYADAIKTAQTYLAGDGVANKTKVIMFISDGDANAKASNMPPSEANNQCHEGITAAAAVTSAGMEFYSVSYGSPTGVTPASCSTDAPAISACSTMQQMATTSKYFYSDNPSGGCNSTANPITGLIAALQQVGSSLLPPRLWPNGTP